MSTWFWLCFSLTILAAFTFVFKRPPRNYWAFFYCLVCALQIWAIGLQERNFEKAVAQRTEVLSILAERTKQVEQCYSLVGQKYSEAKQ